MQVLCAFFFLAMGTVDVYRWVDADGQTHFSDRAQPGAEVLAIPTGSPESSGQSVVQTAGESQAPEPAFNYQSLTITSPTSEEVLWNIEGQLEVAAATQPELQPGHTLQFYLDGLKLTADQGSSQASYREVYRGRHTLRAEVLDQSGTVVAQSSLTTFFVNQTALPPSRGRP